MNRDVVLINPNLMKPPVTPVALDFLGAALDQAGFGVRIVDLAFAADTLAALDAALGQTPLLVGVTVRNLDDCYMVSQDFCLARTREIIAALRDRTDAPIVLGGVSFSIMPEAVMTFCEAPYGVVGDGEQALVRLARALANGQEAAGIPGLIRRVDGRLEAEPPATADLGSIDLTARDWVDNPRYHEEGGQVGFETKRGCGQQCVYCAETAAKGNRVRLRPPEQVARELAGLADRGVTHLHTCDNEFNMPPDHAADVCRALIDAGLGERLRWYAYMAPAPLDEVLIGLMRRAGCAGIDFGADHACGHMLERLGRRHRPDDIGRAIGWCRENGIATMTDLLLGSPGETRETLAQAIDQFKRWDPDRVGVALGVRVYPGTGIGRLVEAQGRDSPNLVGAVDAEPFLLRPVYYLDASLGHDVENYVEQLIGGDPRFLFGKRTATLEDYNYNDNTVLVDAIRQGHKGAYWDILRRIG
jgi:radical SAM family protein/B12 binding protein